MSQDLARLQVRIDANDSRFRQHLSRTRATFDRESTIIETRAGRLDSRLSNIGSRFGPSIMSGLAPLLALLTGGALVSGFNNVISQLDKIGKTADRLGISTDALQEYIFAAERSGVASEQFANSFQRFNRRLAEARQGSGELVKAVEELGLELENTDGTARSNEEVFRDFADAIAKTEDPTERTRLAFQAFGREGVGLVNMLRDGSAGLDTFAQTAQEMNQVIGEDSVRASEALRDQIDTLSNALSNTFVKAAGFAAKAINEFFNINKQGDLAKLRRDLSEVNDQLQRGGTLSLKDGVLMPLSDSALAQLTTRRDEIQAALAALESKPAPAPDIATQPTILETPGPASRGGGGRGFSRSSRAPAAPFVAAEEAQVFTNAVDFQITKLGENEDALKDMSSALLDLGSDFANAAINGENLGNTLARLGIELAKMLLQGGLAGQGPAAGIFGKLFGAGLGLLGGGGASLAGVPFSPTMGAGIAPFSFLPNAKGNAFAFGKVTPFAKGGIVTGPTTFPMSDGIGLMGEAGPEAIMPLTRGPGGKLGVKASGGGPLIGSMTVVSPNADPAQVAREVQMQMKSQLPSMSRTNATRGRVS